MSEESNQGLDWELLELKNLLEYYRIKVKEWNEKEGVVVLSVQEFIKLLKVIKKQDDEIVRLQLDWLNINDW
ncbi:MAG: hypothetical protein DRJ35_07400 [Thermoprotei archaeon]|nr:MAG: hypothetical protein DRJ35_07400 [Thermoprotei archaeon]